MKSWPKINTFLWLVAQNNILTWDNLIKHGFIGPYWCKLYEQEEETLNHLLNLCPYNSYIWDQSANIMRTSDRNRLGPKDTIAGWRRSIFHSPILNGILQFLLGFILWKLWKERNRRTFNSVTRTWQEVWNTIHTNVNETISLHPWMEHDLQFPRNEHHIIRAWNINITPTPEWLREAVGHTSSPTLWEAPSCNFFKLNFDGASKGNLGPASYRAVIQNSDGEILHILAGSMGHNTNNSAEIWSLLYGLQVDLELHLFPLIAEGDSKIVIKILSHLLNGEDSEKLSPSW
jgi:hypothetical protein